MAKVTTPRPTPTRPEQLDRPVQGNTKKANYWGSWGFYSVVLIFIISVTAAFFLLPSAEEIRVRTFIQTTCLVEGYPDYKVIKDNQNHWRGFCVNAIESVELPMHPDLNLPD